jgi:hypothetical protein
VIVIFLYVISGVLIGIFSNLIHRLAEAEDPDIPAGERAALKNEVKYRVLVIAGLVASLAISIWVTVSVDSSGTLICCGLWYCTSVLLYSILSRNRANALRHLQQRGEPTVSLFPQWCCCGHR